MQCCRRGHRFCRRYRPIKPERAAGPGFQPGEDDRPSLPSYFPASHLIRPARSRGALSQPWSDRSCCRVPPTQGNFDKAFSIKLRKTKMPKPLVQEGEAGSHRTTDVLADLFQVLAMKRDESRRVGRRCDRSGARYLCPIPRRLFGGEMSR
jgi:hypothetical protein